MVHLTYTFIHTSYTPLTPETESDDPHLHTPMTHWSEKYSHQTAWIGGVFRFITTWGGGGIVVEGHDQNVSWCSEKGEIPFRDKGARC